MAFFSIRNTNWVNVDGLLTKLLAIVSCYFCLFTRWPICSHLCMWWPNWEIVWEIERKEQFVFPVTCSFGSVAFYNLRTTTTWLKHNTRDCGIIELVVRCKVLHPDRISYPWVDCSKKFAAPFSTTLWINSTYGQLLTSKAKRKHTPSGGCVFSVLIHLVFSFHLFGVDFGQTHTRAHTQAHIQTNNFGLMQSPTLCRLLCNSLNRSHFKLNVKWNLLRQIQKVYCWASCKFGSSFHWEGFVHRCAVQPIWDMSSLHTGSVLLLLLLLPLRTMQMADRNHSTRNWKFSYYQFMQLIISSLPLCAQCAWWCDGDGEFRD